MNCIVVAPPEDLKSLPSPSPWVERWLPVIPARGIVLDLAAGQGRHSRLLLAHDFSVVAVDRNTAGLQTFGNELEIVEADLEEGPWPLGQRQFDGIVVTNYLWRPLFPKIALALRQGGLLIYETFAEGQERFGKPSNPEFLLKPGELQNFAIHNHLEILGYEHGEDSEPCPAIRQRLAARQRAK